MMTVNYDVLITALVMFFTGALIGWEFASNHFKKMQKRLFEQATTDTLTGLPNRLLFEDRLKQTITGLKRDKEKKATLLFVDLDGFKQVNDTFGHLVGDELLQVVAERLRTMSREVDTVARLSGDEFAVILVDTTTEGAVKVAEKMVGRLSRVFEIDNKEIQISASVGIVEISHERDQTMREADDAMYTSKRLGGNRYHISSVAEKNPENKKELRAVK